MCPYDGGRMTACTQGQILISPTFLIFAAIFLVVQGIDLKEFHSHHSQNGIV